MNGAESGKQITLEPYGVACFADISAPSDPMLLNDPSLIRADTLEQLLPDCKEFAIGLHNTRLPWSPWADSFYFT